MCCLTYLIIAGLRHILSLHFTVLIHFDEYWICFLRVGFLHQMVSVCEVFSTDHLLVGVTVYIFYYVHIDLREHARTHTHTHARTHAHTQHFSFLSLCNFKHVMCFSMLINRLKKCTLKQKRKIIKTYDFLFTLIYPLQYAIWYQQGKMQLYCFSCLICDTIKIGHCMGHYNNIIIFFLKFVASRQHYTTTDKFKHLTFSCIKNKYIYC